MAYFDKYGVEFSDDRKTLVKCPKNLQEEYIIPETVNTIGDSAFEDCSCLTHVVIPENVINIGNETFRGCKNLVFCHIGKNVSHIGSLVFMRCSALSFIVVDSENVTFDSRNNCNAIIEKCSNRLIVGCKNTHIPENIKIIGAHAFCQNDIENVIIPARVTVIEECAFFSCSKLQYLTIHSDVLEIGTEAFGGCDNLEVVSIQSKEITFGSFAFANCPKLDILILHGNISMYDNVFTYDELLEIWLYVNTPPVIDAYDFEFADISGCTLYVPASTIDLYKKAVGWNEFKNIREISGK